MADSLAGVTFLSLRGQIHRRRLILEDIGRPHADGHAFRKQGLKAEPTVLLGKKDVLTWTDGAAFIATIQALISTTVTVVQGGFSYPNLEILDAVPVTQANFINSTLGTIANSRHLVFIQFTLIDATPF